METKNLFSKIWLYVFGGLIYFSAIQVKAQAPNWQWSEYAGNTNEDIARAVKVDASGNVYVGGSFQSTSLACGTFTLNNPNGITSDMMLSKYDGNGNIQWAKCAGGHNMSVIRTLAIDDAGNIYAGGYFADTIIFGSHTLINPNSGSNNNIFDIYVVKYDPNGNVIWAKSMGGTDTEYLYSICYSSGNIFLTGFFASPSISFGSTTLINTSAGSGDVYLAKYDTSGNAIWAKSAGGNKADAAQSVSCDPSGNIYLTGNYQSASITFGSSTLVNVDNTGATNDIFLVKYNNAGIVQWAKTAGGTGNDYSLSSADDASGNTFISGYYASPTLPIGSTTLNNAGSFDAFLANYDNAGNVQWAKNIGGSANDFSFTLATDVSGNCYLGGDFGSPTLTIGTTTLTNAGLGDLYIAKYDGSGNVLWAIGAGGNDDDEAISIATDLPGNVYVGGGFASSNITLGANTFTNVGSYDLYIGKLGNMTTGIIPEQKLNNDVFIYPNPTSNQFYVTNILTGQIDVELYDVTGKIMLHEKILYKNQGIDITNLSRGTYSYKLITSEGKQLTGKLVLSK